MEKENTILKERILREFMNHYSDGNVHAALKNIDDPFYSVLSESLQLPGRKVRRIVLENEPYIPIERNR